MSDLPSGNSRIVYLRNYTSNNRADVETADAILNRAISAQTTGVISMIGGREIIETTDPIVLEPHKNIWFQLLNIEYGSSNKTSVTTISFCIESDKCSLSELKSWSVTISNGYLDTKKHNLSTFKYYFDQVPKPIDNRRLHTESTFTQQQFHTNRCWSNIFHEQLELIRTRVEKFKNDRDWYDKRGQTWTLGILLYGPPGCGKTCIAKAIANYLDRHIVSTGFSIIEGKRQLKALFYDEHLLVEQSNNRGTTTMVVPIEDRIFLVEDCDAGGNSVIMRRDKARKNKLSLESQRPQSGIVPGYGSSEPDTTNDLDLDTVLNVLDGVLETPGRVVIFTSNYPDEIDQAIMRPGRIDLVVKLDRITNGPLVEMFRNFYDLEFVDRNKLPQDIFDVTDRKWTPAEAIQIMFRSMDDPAKAAASLCELDPRTEFPLSYFEDPVPEPKVELESIESAFPTTPPKRKTRSFFS